MRFSPPAWLVPALNAYSAVAFFFVLSGFVLHLSLQRRPIAISTVTGFLVKRVFRLYPLFFISLLVAGLALTQPSIATNPFVAGSAYTAATVLDQNHADGFQWLMQLTLISPWTDNTFVNPPMWTLAAEMRISLLFPFLSFLTRKLESRGLLLLTFALFLVSPFLARFTIPTLAMVPLFFLGVVIAEWVRLGKGTELWLPALLTGIALYGVAPWVGSQTQGLTAHLYVAGWGGGLVILALTACQRLSSLLGHPRLRFLGECSYGVYILHFPFILWLVCRDPLTSAGGAAFFSAVWALTIASSFLLFHLIEAPCIRAGYRLDKWLQQKNRNLNAVSRLEPR